MNWHLSHIYSKLGVNSRDEAVAREESEVTGGCKYTPLKSTGQTKNLWEQAFEEAIAASTNPGGQKMQVNTPAQRDIYP
ncbi:hypothetical protein [Pseudomonas jessenii]|uniref:hypothetical protein n=1 Tax=Pseudomonas jessenii TaxID=77298 RepID=UPI0038914474